MAIELSVPDRPQHLHFEDTSFEATVAPEADIPNSSITRMSRSRGEPKLRLYRRYQTPSNFNGEKKNTRPPIHISTDEGKRPSPARDRENTSCKQIALSRRLEATSTTTNLHWALRNTSIAYTLVHAS
jgi:hypothetical protein